jgi:hypothetical protein
MNFGRNMNLKIFICLSFFIAFMFGCATTTKPIKQHSKAQQQLEAQKAFEELDREVENPTLEEPKFEKFKQPELKKSPETPTTKSVEKSLEKPREQVAMEKKLDKSTKFPMRDGRPVWFYDPNYDGYFGAIGIARKSSTKGGYATQKRLAKTLAQAELSKQLKVFVDTELTTEKERILTKVSDSYRSTLTTLSVHKSEELLTNAQIIDEWIDPNSGDLYVWLVLLK